MNRHLFAVLTCSTLLIGDITSVSAQEAGNLVLSGGYVMSLDPAVGDLEKADILVRDGTIVEIAPRIEAPGVGRLDVTDKLVMPGLIDTHTHLWTSAMKGWFQNTEESDYFGVKVHFARHYTPEDIRIGTYFGAVETLASGVTTTVDFFHNNRGAEFFDANLQALRDSGIRARLLYGPHDDMPAGETVDLDHLGTLAREWQDKRISLGFGWRGTGNGTPERLEVGKKELEFVRDLGLPISVHATGKAIGSLAESGLSGKDVQIIHATGATPEQLRKFDESGASLALTPVTEQRVGYGEIAIGDFKPMQRIGVGIDGPSLAGSADLFTNLRLLALNESGSSKNETGVDPRRMLEMLTLGAARSIGMENEIGSITVGKRADMIVLDMKQINFAPMPQGDPAALVVYSAHPSNVEMVMVDGEIRKRDGKLLDVDVPSLMEDVKQSIDGVVSRSGGWPIKE